MEEWQFSTELERCPFCKRKEIDAKMETKSGPIACTKCKNIVFQTTKEYDNYIEALYEEEEKLVDQSNEFMQNLLENGNPLNEIPEHFIGRWWKQQNGIGIFDIQPSGTYQYAIGTETRGISVETVVGEIKIYHKNENSTPNFEIPKETQYYVILQAKKSVIEENDNEKVQNIDENFIYFAKSAENSQFPFLIDILEEEFPYLSNDWIKADQPSIIEQINGTEI